MFFAIKHICFFVGICNWGYYLSNLSTSTIVCSSVLCIVEIMIKTMI